MIRLATAGDIPAINAILNDPAVKPTAALGQSGDLDVTTLFNGRNVILSAPGGGAVFAWSSPGVFEGHSFFLPTIRGRKAVALGREMLIFMFRHGAQRIWGQTPADNRPACMFNRLLGFKSLGFDTAPFPQGRIEVELFQMEASCL